jgi:biotin carboxyl carrier protein
MTRDTLIEGRSGRIRIEGSRFRYEREDGRIVEGEFSVEPLDPDCRRVTIDGRVYRVAPGARGEALVNGRPVAIEVFDPRGLRSRKSGGASGGRQEISASMPGKVVRVLVQTGDSVEAGQGLVVVEAMKMQNEMKSPKAGRVAEVRTRPDAAVVAGETLIVVE